MPARLSVPHRFITRENRGSVATVNEGLALASGAFINILHSDDAFAAERFAVFVREVAQTGCDWGFSGVRFIDAEDRPIAADDLHVAHLNLVIDDLPREVSTGMALLSTNVSITTGNLFVRRAFWDRIGGLVPYKYNDDWEFCIRATRAAEPVYLPDRLFSYRFHGSNTILNAARGFARRGDRNITGVPRPRVDNALVAESVRSVALRVGPALCLEAVGDGPPFRNGRARLAAACRPGVGLVRSGNRPDDTRLAHDEHHYAGWPEHRH